MTKPIATIGTDNDFVELFMDRVNDLVRLYARGTQHIGSVPDYSSIGKVMVCEEDAVNAAVDLEYAAFDFLDARGGRGYKDNGLGFGEAVEKALGEVNA